MSRILVVEDNADLVFALRTTLQMDGHEVEAAMTGPDGVDRALELQPDLVILDVMLPGMDGFAFCRKVRETSRVPIVMLTARGEVHDRIVGLELGADDYLPKPFEPRELVARIQAVLRRRAPAIEDETLRAGELELNRSRGTARLGGRELALTTAELELLDLLMRNRGRILSRDRILEATRGVDWEAYDRSVDVLVSRLRQKLGDDARRPRLIRTVRGAGYSYVGGGADE